MMMMMIHVETKTRVGFVASEHPANPTMVGVDDLHRSNHSAMRMTMMMKHHPIESVLRQKVS